MRRYYVECLCFDAELGCDTILQQVVPAKTKKEAKQKVQDTFDDDYPDLGLEKITVYTETAKAKVQEDMAESIIGTQEKYLEWLRNAGQAGAVNAG